jgi:hypothetical protein
MPCTCHLTCDSCRAKSFYPTIAATHKRLIDDKLEKEHSVAEFIRDILMTLKCEKRNIEGEFCVADIQILSPKSLYLNISLKTGYGELLQSILHRETNRLREAGYEKATFYGRNMSVILSL